MKKWERALTLVLAVCVPASSPMPAGAEDDPPEAQDASAESGAPLRDDAPPQADEAGPPPGTLVAALPVPFDDRRLDECADSPSPRLNEICAVGTECDEDVRVADFIEVYNPGAAPVDLGCFVLVGREGKPFVPRGSLGPNEILAWGEADLEWRIRKGGDEIQLLRVTRGVDGLPELVPLESVALDAERAHLYRSPDGGAWRQVGTEDAEYHRTGSFGEPNPRPSLADGDPR